MKQAVILCGIPGSGKSSYVAGLQEMWEDIVVCSADLYFTRSGEYKFDPTLLGEAHGSCLKKYVSALINEQRVVVDNTNTTLLEMAPYVTLGMAYGYQIQVIRFRVDPEVAAARNIHGVPLNVCRAMAERLDSLEIPPYWKVSSVIL